jgi:hypothetical protein
VLDPVVVRDRGIVKGLYFRGDAAFGNFETHEFLEAKRIGCTTQLRARQQFPAAPDRLSSEAPGRATAG